MTKTEVEGIFGTAPYQEVKDTFGTIYFWEANDGSVAVVTFHLGMASVYRDWNGSSETIQMMILRWLRQG